MKLPSAISLRPICAEDTAFLFQLYASTRIEELAVVPWTDEEKASFLWMQFAAQHEYYQQHYRSTSFDVLLVEGQPAGRLYLARWPEEFRIVDIALMPNWRGFGFGTAVLQAIIAEAAEAGLPVSIHVEPNNPALRLYQRLGFEHVSTTGVYLLMKRAATSTL